MVGTPKGSPKGSQHRLFTWKYIIDIFCTSTSVVFSQNTLLQNFTKTLSGGSAPRTPPVPTLVSTVKIFFSGFLREKPCGGVPEGVPQGLPTQTLHIENIIDILSSTYSVQIHPLHIHFTGFLRENHNIDILQ